MARVRLLVFVTALVGWALGFTNFWIAYSLGKPEEEVTNLLVIAGVTTALALVSKPKF